MFAAHTLRSLQAGITDIRMLVQHSCLAAGAAFADVLQRWADPRGRRLAAEHLDPQVRQLGLSNDALLVLAGTLETAARHAHAAEEHLMQARLAAGDVHPAQAEARRLTARAWQLAALACERTSSAEASGRSIGSALNELGMPPV
jgi:hypothetical protein